MPLYQNWNMGLAKNQEFVSSTLTRGTYVSFVCGRRLVCKTNFGWFNSNTALLYGLVAQLVER